jgi:hypothetical protein
MPRLRIALSLLVVALLAPAAAFAARTVTKAQRTQILAAVVKQHELTKAQAACQAVTVSTVNSAYAEVKWPAKLTKSCQRIAANGVIIEHRTGGQWKLVTVGSDFHCPIKGLPTKVGRDLGVCK